ncbi:MULTISPECIES: flagellar assembly peptidoglycan hydrolase FlgJ [Marinobacter]|uniref:flagellar assembly peptidoglycan hydrolase FlgJ n=1 Tax=Marinobacter TaxID=2742 RepID=UPI001D06829A|nr:MULTISPECIES: flagellar assembly peptidoglycan hydrolase FlgJ [Marinobacter]MCK7565795.1 flagellar assembly peptidoglycan hydrolase FlgJ [Marinobacter xestospongiae]UDL03521.1 flagellar assembly peptidoglycan hydrolase FlgJ [Marinobacter sp. CA1]
MQDPRLQQSRIYTDFGGLNALKAEARSDRKAALEEVAKQFEGLFLTEIMKSMRKANEVFSEGNLLNSQQSKFYQDMFDNQLSLTLSDQGLGLSDTLVRQLSRQIPGMSAEGERRAGHKADIAAYDRSLPSLSRQLPERLAEVKAVAASSAPATDSVLPSRFESPQQFVSQLLPLAEAAAADSGIDPRLMVAQAALETGWGRHMIEGEQGAPSFNLFGIKADGRWQGDSVNIATSEYRDGVRMSERAQFRAYPDYQASFHDYVDFLKSNPRYREVLASAEDPAQFADQLQAAGYATDPHYANKIRRIMAGETMNQPVGASGQSSPGADG